MTFRDMLGNLLVVKSNLQEILKTEPTKLLQPRGYAEVRKMLEMGMALEKALQTKVAVKEAPKASVIVLDKYREAKQTVGKELE